MRTLYSDMQIGAVQTAIIGTNGGLALGALAAAPDHTCNITIQEKPLDILQKQVGPNVEVFSPIGAAVTVKKEVFQLVSGFDGAYFIDHEDLDLGWRIRLSGFILLEFAILSHYAEGEIEDPGQWEGSRCAVAASHDFEDLDSRIAWTLRRGLRSSASSV